MTGVLSALGGTSIYGSSGNDTIDLKAALDAGSALLLSGGDNDDVIGNTAFRLSGVGTGQIVDGGSGADTIKFGANAAAIGNLTVLGGAGHDSIYINASGISANAMNLSVLGGAGADQIYFDNTSVITATMASCATIVGGAGADTLTLGLTALGSGIDAQGIVNAGATTLTGGVMGNYVYSSTESSGDKIVLGVTGITGQGSGTNWGDANAGIYVFGSTGIDGTALSVAITGGATAAGSVFAYDSGTDLVIGVQSLAGSESLFINVQGGDELLKVTQTGEQSMVASNFGFTISTDGTTGNIVVNFT